MKEEIKKLEEIGEEYLYNYFYLGNDISSDIEAILMNLLGFNEDGTPYNPSLPNVNTITYDGFIKQFKQNKHWRLELMNSMLTNVYSIALAILYRDSKAQGISISDEHSFGWVAYVVNEIYEANDIEYCKLVDYTNVILKNILNVNEDISLVQLSVNPDNNIIDFTDLFNLYQNNAFGILGLLRNGDVEDDLILNVLRDQMAPFVRGYIDYYYALTLLMCDFDNISE